MTADVEAELKRLEGLLAAAQDKVSSTQPIDLSGLETGVEALCGAIAAQPGSGDPTLRRRLVVILDEMDRLSSSMQDALGALRESIGQSSNLRTALSAYSSSLGRGSGPSKT